MDLTMITLSSTEIGAQLFDNCNRNFQTKFKLPTLQKIIEKYLGTADLH